MVLEDWLFEPPLDAMVAVRPRYRRLIGTGTSCLDGTPALALEDAEEPRAW